MKNTNRAQVLGRGAMLLGFAFFLSPEGAHAAIPAAQRSALVDLYNSTNGDSWVDNSNWKMPPLGPDGFAMPGTENTWYGITCDAGDTVTRIALSSNNLVGGLPASIGDLANLEQLRLGSNQLVGSIPTFASNTALTYLDLSSNRLGGSIPSFASNTGLTVLDLSSNQLGGSIPSFASNTGLTVLRLSSNHLVGPVHSTLGSLSSLSPGGLDLRWNALRSTDGPLIAFLDSKQVGGDWQSTQTVPVTGLSVTGLLPTQVTVNWTPIPYTGDPGYYQVFFSMVSGPPYTPFATVTTNKSATSLTVTGLTPLTPYHFVVQTTTQPHANNQNTVLSGHSAEVSSATTPVELMRFEID
jgi:hypothetical protein